MSIWNIDLGWFALGTFVILMLVVIAMERISYNERKEMEITRKLDNPYMMDPYKIRFESIRDGVATFSEHGRRFNLNKSNLEFRILNLKRDGRDTSTEEWALTLFDKEKED